MIIRSLIIISIVFAACKEQRKEAKLVPPTPPDAVQVKNAVTTATVSTSVDEYAAYKYSLDSLFRLKQDSAKFVFQDYSMSLLIGNLFSKENKDAVLMYKLNDSVSNMCVLRRANNKWDTLLSKKILNVYNQGLNELIQITDFNADNIPDLEVIKRFWVTHTGSIADLWFYKNDRFIKVDGFDDIVNAEYDKKTNLIYSYQSAGCADMAMNFGVYTIIGNKVKNMQFTYCDCCSEKHDSCLIERSKNRRLKIAWKNAYKYVPKFYSIAVKEKLKN